MNSPPIAYMPDFDGSWRSRADAPMGQELILKLCDGSELHGCQLQADGYYSWGLGGGHPVDFGFVVGWKPGLSGERALRVIQAAVSGF